jgi:ATP-dependent Clp protease ATP-binding subunit ClpX
MRYGLIPEFVGRLPVVATLDELDEDALMQILTQPKNALTRQYRRLFKMDGVTLKFDDGALMAIAQLALKQKTGARGLRSILERIMLTFMYELPGRTDIDEITITEEMINEADESAIPFSETTAESA